MEKAGKTVAQCSPRKLNETREFWVNAGVTELSLKTFPVKSSISRVYPGKFRQTIEIIVMQNIQVKCGTGVLVVSGNSRVIRR